MTTQDSALSLQLTELPAELLTRVAELCRDIVPSLEDQFSVTGDQNQKRIRVIIDFNTTKEAEMKMLCGAVRSNLRMLLHYLRVQQILPHNRYIELVLTRMGTEDQVYINKDVSTNRRQAKNPAELAKIMQRNQLIVVRNQVEVSEG